MGDDFKAHVLLVDDEKDFLDILATRLRNRDMDVSTATSGEKALSISRKAKFDIIVIDLAMPGMNGIETIKQIKAERPNAEVIILTGHANIKSSVEAMKVGAEDFLEKPVDIEVLLKKISLAQRRTLENFEKQCQRETEKILRKRGW